MCVSVRAKTSSQFGNIHSKVSELLTGDVTERMITLRWDGASLTVVPDIESFQQTHTYSDVYVD